MSSTGSGDFAAAEDAAGSAESAISLRGRGSRRVGVSLDVANGVAAVGATAVVGATAAALAGTTGAAGVAARARPARGVVRPESTRPRNGASALGVATDGTSGPGPA